MKKYIFTYMLLAVIGYGCSDSATEDKKQCFTISSKGIADNSSVSGGQYRILDQQGNVVQTHTLDNGTANVYDLPEGTYTIEEITAPEGYIADQKKKTVTLNGSGCKNAVFLYIDEDNPQIPSTFKVNFYGTDTEQLMGEYNAIRIGEYYWIDRNFSHVVPWGGDFENSYPITQQLLDRYVERVRIDPSQFQVANLNDFEKYYGRYYSYPSILYMNQHGQMRDLEGNAMEGWRLPYQRDYRQLFAMCPFNTSQDSPHINLNERDVRFALGAKAGDNPMAYDIQDPNNSTYKTYWFNASHTTNMYKFGLMPGGARLNGDGAWCNSLGPNNGCYDDGKKGDIYHLFYTAPLAVVDPKDDLAIGTVTIHDYVDTYEHVLYHMLNVRWCRKLTDAELGYKLYINPDQSDIKKVDWDAPAPNGYTELQNGYTRGFYVQYILDNPNPTLTVSDIVNYARRVEDRYVSSNKDNPSLVL